MSKNNNALPPISTGTSGRISRETDANSDAGNKPNIPNPSWTNRKRDALPPGRGFLNLMQGAQTFMNEPISVKPAVKPPAADGTIVFDELSKVAKSYINKNKSIQKDIEDAMILHSTLVQWPKLDSKDIVLSYKQQEKNHGPTKTYWGLTIGATFASILQAHIALATVSFDANLLSFVEDEVSQNPMYQSYQGNISLSTSSASIIGKQAFVSSSFISLQKYIMKLTTSDITVEVTIGNRLYTKLLALMEEFVKLKETYADIAIHLLENKVLLVGKQYATPQAESDLKILLKSFCMVRLDRFSSELLSFVGTGQHLKHLNEVLWNCSCQLGWDEGWVLVGTTSQLAEHGLVELENNIAEAEIPIKKEVTQLARWISFYGTCKHANEGNVVMSYVENMSIVKVIGLKKDVEELVTSMQSTIQQLNNVEFESISYYEYSSVSPTLFAYIKSFAQEEVEMLLKKVGTSIQWPEGGKTTIYLKFTPAHDVPYESHFIWKETIHAVFQNILNKTAVEKHIPVPESLTDDVMNLLDKEAQIPSNGNIKRTRGSLNVVGRPEWVENTFARVKYHIGSLESSIDIFQLELENKAHLELISDNSFAQSFTAKHTHMEIIIALTSVILKGKTMHLKHAESDLKEILSRIAIVPIKQSCANKDLEQIVGRPDNIRRIKESLKNAEYPCTCYKDGSTLMLVGISEEIVFKTLGNMNSIIKSKRIAVKKEIFELGPWIDFFTRETTRTAEYLGIAYEKDSSEIIIHGLAVDVDDMETTIDTFIKESLATVNVEFKLDQFTAGCLLRQEAEFKAYILKKYNKQCMDITLVHVPESYSRVHATCIRHVVNLLKTELEEKRQNIKKESFEISQVGLSRYFQGEGLEWLESVSYKHKSFVDIAYGSLKQDVPPAKYILKFKSGLNLNLFIGAIENQQADVLVNTTSETLKFTGPLSMSLIERGGKGLQEEMNKLQVENAASGDVLITGGYFLHCKKVFHMVINKWNGKTLSTNNLCKAVRKVLTLADENGFKTVAFPAIGSGGFNWPPKVVAQSFLKCVHEISKGRIGLDEIRMVILPSCDEAIESYADEIFATQLGFKITDSMVPTINKENLNDAEIIEEHVKWEPKLTITVHGFLDEEVKTTMDKFKARCASLFKEYKVAEGDVIRYLGEKERQSIRSLTERKGVQVTIKQSGQECYIHLQGLPGDVEAAGHEIKSILTNIELLRIAGGASMATWEHYNKSNSKFEEFSAGAVSTLELAFRKKTNDVVTVEENGLKYSVDMKSRIGTFECGGKQKTCKVFRRSLDLPRNWYPTDEMKIYKVNQNDADYNTSKSLFLKTIGDKYTPKIHMIRRVQNPDRFRAFLVQEKTMQNQLPAGEVVYQRQLWHGTSKETTSHINRHNFDRSYTKVHKFGKGVYFALNSKYSANDKYTPPDERKLKRMYLARVLVGRYTKGSEKDVACPPIDPDKPTIKFDSLCDNSKNPTIFVIFNDAQAYPEFIVYFSLEDKVKIDSSIEAKIDQEEGF